MTDKKQDAHAELMTLAEKWLAYARMNPANNEHGLKLRAALDAYARALTDRIAELEAENLKLEILCDATYVDRGADAYHHACEQMERYQEKRRKAGKEVGTTHSLCDGMDWVYGRLDELEAQLDAVGAGGVGAMLPRHAQPAPVAVVDEDEDGLFADFETESGVLVERGDKLYAAPQPQQIAEPAAAEPDWYHAECDDPDRSGFYLEKSDALTQVDEHGGYVTELCARLPPPQIAEPASQWISVDERLPEPGKAILLGVGKKTPLRAMWVPQFFLELGQDSPDDFGEYCEPTDEYYYPEGWYEWNSHEEAHWAVSETPSHWMPLPAPPETIKEPS